MVAVVGMAVAQRVQLSALCCEECALCVKFGEQLRSIFGVWQEGSCVFCRSRFNPSFHILASAEQCLSIMIRKDD